MVACLKRLLPVGLNLFAGREQELVQHCKDRFLKVKSLNKRGKFLNLSFLKLTEDARVRHHRFRKNSIDSAR